MCDAVLFCFLPKVPLLWIAALLMHGPCIFTCFTLLMGPPIGLWTLAIDSWLLFFAASLSHCNCIVIAFVSFGYNWRFVCLGWFSLVLGGRLFPQAILFCFPFAWIFMFLCTAGFQLVSQACLATFWSIQYLHLIKKKKSCLGMQNMTLVECPREMIAPFYLQVYYYFHIQCNLKILSWHNLTYWFCI
jgi:hypothetical protein